MRLYIVLFVEVIHDLQYLRYYFIGKYIYIKLSVSSTADEALLSNDTCVLSKYLICINFVHVSGQ